MNLSKGDNVHSQGYHLIYYTLPEQRELDNLIQEVRSTPALSVPFEFRVHTVCKFPVKEGINSRGYCL
jgi:hypothetical protein